MFRHKNTTLEGLEVDKIKSNIWVYVILGLALFAMTFVGVVGPSQESSIPSGLVAQVGPEEVTAMEFRRARQEMLNRYNSRGDFDPIKNNLSAMVVNQLVDQRLTVLLANESGVGVSDKEIRKTILTAGWFNNEDDQFDAARFNNYLNYQKHTEASFTEDVRRQLQAQKLQQLVTATTFVPESATDVDYMLENTKFDFEYIEIDQKDVKVNVDAKKVDAYLADAKNETKLKDYYNNNKDKYQSEQKVKARHILIAYKGARNVSGDAAKRGKEQARKKAEKLHDQLKAGAAFEKIAKDNSDDKSNSSKGGDLGYFLAGDMVKEFSEPLFKMKKGQLSGIIESPFGFHIARVDAIQKKKNVSFESAKKGIATNLLKNELKPEMLKAEADSVLKGVKSNASSYAKRWKASGEVAGNQRYIPGIGGDDDLLNKAFKLRKKGELIGTPIMVGNKAFVVRLKSFKAATAKKSDDNESSVAEMAAMRQGMARFRELKSNLEKSLNKNNRILKNVSFVNLDKNRAAQ